jgi:hypothetical protein
MKTTPRKRVRRTTARQAAAAASVSLALLPFVFFAVVNASRVQDGPTVNPEPAPAMKYVPASERARLAAEESDAKDRTKLSLELAEARLAQAEQLTAASRFLEASGALGIYQALVADAIQYLQRNGQPVKGKVPNKYRDLFKRVELALRSHGPRLETIRRQTPSEEATTARAVYEYVRQARATALESFYGETVLREGSSQKDRDKPADGQRPGDATPTPGQQQR